MEFLEGHTLHHLIPSRPLDTATVLSLGIEIAGQPFHYDATCYPEAHKDLERALELNPHAPYAHQLLSAVLGHEGKPHC